LQIIRLYTAVMSEWGTWAASCTFQLLWRPTSRCGTNCEYRSKTAVYK